MEKDKGGALPVKQLPCSQRLPIAVGTSDSAPDDLAACLLQPPPPRRHAACLLRTLKVHLHPQHSLHIRIGC